MADLFTVTAPLSITLPSGESRLMVEHFKHPKGLLYFTPYWHIQDVPGDNIYLVKGWIGGEGPWQISEHRIEVLACHGVDVCLATDFNDWQNYRMMCAEEYPPEPLVEAIARKFGAIIE
ncbi:MAG: hypothetical protein ACWA5U_10835 [bacterium]